MIVIWGTRRTGKVDHRDGQYGLTRFAHVYWLPLFPVSALWMTDENRGHRMKMTWKGIAAGYARTWGFVAGIAGVAVGGSARIAGAIGIAAAAASFAWKDTRGTTAMRRSDLNLLAFGTRCDPKLMPPELAGVLRPELEARWARISNGQSPSDVARFGTEDLERAAAAYGVLRLTALSLPAKPAAEAEAEATRIAEGVRETAQLGAGPYRSTTVAGTIGEIGDERR